MESNESMWYEALIARDERCDGIFYVGVETTGIFCRPTCVAPKPKYENCTYFRTAQEALLAGFRPCKRCNPLTPTSQNIAEIHTILDAVENRPNFRWQSRDFLELPNYTAAVEHHFYNETTLTFVAYARARRLGLAFRRLRTAASQMDHCVRRVELK